jgi:hypothetical protein
MIFNKDGKVYVLSGPNPIVKKQESWDISKLIFHNFNWQSIEIKSSDRPNKIKSNIKIKSQIIQDVPSPQPTQKMAADTVASDKPTSEDSERIFDLPHIKYKVLSYCLPAMLEKRIDNLYGESWSRVKYSKKFIFPSVVITATDFSLEFWTSDPKQQITENSIIYPFSYEVYNQNTDSYDKVPYDEYRWWKVSEKEKRQEGGWLFKTIPSEVQPDFSS